MQAADFTTRLEQKIRQQLAGQSVGYLLGAGSSYLDGRGYPLAQQLWERIRNNIRPKGRQAIQQQIDAGASGLEHALDLLDHGGPGDLPLRHEVAATIADLFRGINCPTDSHSTFVKRLASRGNYRERIFSLNYDPLLELAAAKERVRVVDGFVGPGDAFFDASVFGECAGRKVNKRGRMACDRVRGAINLTKLHGSLGWYDSPGTGARRQGYGLAPPAGTKPLMIPPQYRKAADTVLPPYSALWSDFRAALVHGPDLLNRLMCVGYGMRDEHVNAVLDAAAGRHSFTLIIAARALADDAFGRWGHRNQTIVITEARSSLYGEIGLGHPTLWALEGLCREMR